MRNTILKVAMFALITLIAGYNAFTNSKEESKLSNLMLDNVEALASNEEPGITCSKTCSDGIGRCYAYDKETHSCYFEGYQWMSCAC